MPDYSIITAGSGLAILMTVFFAIVRETNSRASKAEKQIGEIKEGRQEMIDVELMSAANIVLRKSKYRVGRLSPEDRQKIYSMIFASANLNSLTDSISRLEDKATQAYIWGVGFVVAILGGTFCYAFADVSSFPLSALVPFIAFVAIGTGFRYFSDGILALRHIRAAEKTIARLKTATNVARLDAEMCTFLKLIEASYLVAHE